jgi:hypothetical protein
MGVFAGQKTDHPRSPSVFAVLRYCVGALHRTHRACRATPSPCGLRFSHRAAAVRGVTAASAHAGPGGRLSWGYLLSGAYPRCFDILLGDGLCTQQARLFKLLHRQGKHALVVLKDERRDLLKDARGLFGPKPHTSFTRDAARYQCWDIEHLDSWDSYPEKVRVVRSVETTTSRERKKGRWTERQQTMEWVWVTTLPAAEVPTVTMIV